MFNNVIWIMYLEVLVCFIVIYSKKNYCFVWEKISGKFMIIIYKV